MRAILGMLVLLAQDPAAPVTAEFRIFAGTEEITASTRLRIMPTGTREKSSTIEEGKRLAATLPPGIYDVQALRLRPEGIIAIRWAERLVVMHYPDEGGRHLEVINFQPGYGALQVRAAKGPIAAYDLAVFSAGDRATAAGQPIQGEDYRLFVLKAGRYDIRVRHAGTQKDAQDTHWVLDVEVPADRTRLKLVDAGANELDDGPPAADQIDDEQHDCNHEQYVHDPACNIEREAQQPEQQQQDD
jgi:hypothetical protein